MAPDHNIAPSEKDKKWISNNIEYHWNNYKTGGRNTFYNYRTEYDKIKMYAMGMQSTNQYVDQVVPDALANNDKTWERINFEVFPLIPKYRRIMIDTIKKLRYTANVEVVDSQAMDDQAKYFADIAARIRAKNEIEAAGVNAGDLVKSDEPQDLEELAIHMNYSYKHVAAVEIETALNLFDKDNRYDEIRDRAIESLVDYNIAVIREWRDYDGQLKAKHIDLDRFICETTQDPYFSDIQYAGEVMMMSLSDIKNNLLEEDKVEFNKIISQIESFNNGTSQWKEIVKSGKANVLRLEFLSRETKKFELRTTKSGNKVFGKKSGGKKNKQFHDAEYDVVYAGYWVLDTQFFFRCKKETNMKRDHRDLSVTRTSYHPIATELYRNRTKSIIEQLIPTADAACIAWYKLQAAVQRSKPAGVLWELSSLQNLEIGNQSISPKQNLMMYNLTGNLAYRRIDEEGDVTNWSPIEQLPGGMQGQGAEYLALLDSYVNFTRNITGLNEITDSSSPDPKMLKSVAQLAQLSSNNSIRFIHETERRLTERVKTDVMLRFQDKAQDGGLDMYSKALGEASVKFFKLSKDTGWRTLGIFFTEEPDVEEKERLENLIQIAMTPQAEGGYSQITLEQANFIRSINNTDAASMYLAHVIKKNEEKREQQIAQRDEANSQRSMQAAKVAEEEKRKTKEFEHSLEMQKIQFEYEMKMKVEQVKGSYISDSHRIGAEARDRENIRNTETKRYEAEMKKETDKAKNSADK